MAISIAAALGLVSLLPTPTYPQYFVTLIPFLIVGALELLRTPVPDRPERIAWTLFRSAVVLTCVLYLAVAAYTFDRTLQWPERHPQPSDVSRVAHFIDANTRPGEVVLAFSPRHVYESHAQRLPGVESDYAATAAETMGLSHDHAIRYRILPFADIRKLSAPTKCSSSSSPRAASSSRPDHGGAFSKHPATNRS